MALLSPAPGPCDGIRILDFTTVVSGPTCTQALGDFGADVIKVETLVGDMSRMSSGPYFEGLSGFFAQFNRNKRSIAIDLKNEAGRSIVHRLAPHCDVVVENFRPGVSDRLGIGWEALHALSPSLIHVAINGFGGDGPYAPLPAYDHIVQGLTGMMAIQGGDGPPQMFRSVVADKIAGLTAVSAILGALLARERGAAEGQRIEVPMLDAYAAFMLPEAMGPISFPDSEEVPTPFDPFRVYPTVDGYVVGMVVQDHQFLAICRVVERPDWVDDSRFDSMGARFQNMDEFAELLLGEFRRFETDDLIRRARKEGAPFAPVHDFEAFLEDPQVRHSEVVQVIDDPDVRVRILRPPARLSATPTSVRRRPPRLGEHTDELLELAGFDTDAVEDLRQRGVVR